MVAKLTRDESILIDVSKWQHPINWTKVLAFRPKIEAVVHRATIGIWYVDSFFISAYQKLKELNIPRSAYMVIRPEYTGKAQAKWFEDTLNRTGDSSSDLPLILDCEIAGNYSKAHMAQVVYDAANYLEDAFGHKPIIYSRTGWVNSHIGSKQWLNNYEWWMAIYWWNGLQEYPHSDISLPPTIDPKQFIIHQTTDRADGTAVGTTSKQVDVNRWVHPNKSLAQYIADFKGVPLPDSLPPQGDLTIEQKVNRLWAAHPQLY